MSSRVADAVVVGQADAFDALRMPKAAALAAARVRHRIVRGELKADDALPPESELMRQFGISRPTLREALRILEAEGLISVRRGARGGPRVQAPSPEAAVNYVGLLLEYNQTSLADVLQAQAVLEVGAVRALAEGTTRAVLKTLDTLLEQEEAAIGDVDRFSAAAAEFHSQLIELAGSQTLALMGHMLAKIIMRHGVVVASVQPSGSAGVPGWQTKSHEIHRAVVDLIKSRDAKRAAHLWAAHCKANMRATLADTPKNTVLDLFD
jgi:DNA-binding FadR family transcriptional regulator